MMTFHIKVSAASMMILLCASVGVSSSAAAKSSGSQVSPKSKPVTVFELSYGSCSRSVAYRATYASLQQATVAARQVGQRDGLTRILSTDLPQGIRDNYSSANQVSYRVYVRSRCGQRWLSYTAYTSLKKARAAVSKQYGKQPEYVQIIPHYSQKAVAVSRK